ncbi:hypothetical protein [uncultured Oxalicibacterium sp.]|uniref:hypothetical protein n=1 Tax=uncultured Oxalicibacterium sp. TaxID=1168540 RepID=UPI0025D8C713|nr:hypothetical protein [uncultured Oxalicibacterium sp.]
MANKALAKRQKMTLRAEPSHKAPRNPFALAAKQRVAGSHQASTSSQRQTERRLLDRLLQQAREEDT